MTSIYSQNADEIRAWMELVIELGARGFTPDQVKADYMDKVPKNKQLELIVNKKSNNQEFDVRDSWSW